ncbi:MAG TPA: flagellar hook-basal body complex protein FliE [Syntrophomonadaceae bacterium]|nr:flagellar hook-basal body complex protein FliE [Syntrophomonadaceae bacterium]
MKLDVVNPKLLINDYFNENQSSKVDKNVSFISYLKEALNEVELLQNEASYGASKLVLGEEEYLHNTMLGYEKANLALQLTIEVRNKILEAYQEIMRIQM